MRQRAAEARLARLGTVTVDGRPHLVPVCFAVDRELLYSAIDDVKAKTTLRLRRLENIRLNPGVSLLVDHYAEDWSALWWIRMDGHSRVVDPSSPKHDLACQLLAAKYQQYRRQRPPGPVIEVEIDAWVGWP